MGLLDFIFGSKKKEQERQRLEKEHRHDISRKVESHNSISKMASQESSDIAFLAVFSASWCGPSKRFIKEINQAGITNYAYIDVDKEENLSGRFDIRSVPTILLIDKNDNVIKKWVGYDDEDPGQSKFVQFIKSYPTKIVPYKNMSNQINPVASLSERNPRQLTKLSFSEDNRSHFYELEYIKYRSMGEELMLAPYDAQYYFQFPDAKILPALANTKKICRFLPNLGFTDEEATKKRLEGYLLKTENQLGVTYVIRLKNFPIGMIFVNTPLYNKKSIGKAIWTIDFFISEQFEHKGIVYNAVLRVLDEMKNAMGAKIVYALVDQANSDCINLIGKGLFERIDVEGFKNVNNGIPPLVYMIDIEHTNFAKR